MAESVSDLTIPYDKLARSLQAAEDDTALYQAVVNAPFDHKAATAFLFLSFITLNLVDEPKGEIYLASASDTEGYWRSIEGYDFHPAEYRIPLDDPKSTLVLAITSGKPQTISDWTSLSRPEASEDTVRLNQANSGVTYSVVYPLGGKVRGALMYSFIQYQGSIGPEQHAFMKRYTEMVSAALSRRS